MLSFRFDREDTDVFDREFVVEGLRCDEEALAHGFEGHWRRSRSQPSKASGREGSSVRATHAPSGKRLISRRRVTGVRPSVANARTHSLRSERWEGVSWATEGSWDCWAVQTSETKL